MAAISRPRVRCTASTALFVVGILGLAGCGGGPRIDNAFGVNGRVAPVAARNIQPRLVGSTLTGERLDVTAWRGHVIVVNVWGSWCGPCRAEAPELARAAANTAAEGVRFIGIDVKDTPANALAFESDYHITYPSLNDPGGNLELAFRPLTGPYVPYTMILDPNGRVAARFIGRTSYSPLSNAIEQVRAERTSTP